ncbi:hypothetical protein J45TS6_03770 [Paenibacillus sp. J45TS6]|uniref:hypothetical protein n=1 Tax=Paenibacillus sp. J45TS6 TaxID=2807196 RepID=UPI001B2B0A48|nr:hypothetical protein [Paenibacillus sp. J45TS6]GIP41918.1 hypothetical protein J45TS6_03770 [Paenibacillus sp. J45TS6]
MKKLRDTFMASCIIAILLLNLSGCTLEPSEETIMLQERFDPESELPIIDDVYSPSIRDDVYSSTDEEILIP